MRIIPSLEFNRKTAQKYVKGPKFKVVPSRVRFLEDLKTAWTLSNKITDQGTSKFLVR